MNTMALVERAPKSTKKAVGVFESGELKKFFDSLEMPNHLIVFEVLLKTGQRMQEAMFLDWHNLVSSGAR